jgi:hypothetical protein
MRRVEIGIIKMFKLQVRPNTSLWCNDLEIGLHKIVETCCQNAWNEFITVLVLNFLNKNNILNLFVDFEAMKMCLDVEYNSNSFWIFVWVSNFWDWKKVFFNGRKWLEMIGLYEKLCIMIGVKFIKKIKNKLFF